MGAELPSLDEQMDVFSEDQFSFAPLEGAYTDSLCLDQDIASTLSTPFPLSPQVSRRRSKKAASAKNLHEGGPQRKK